MPFPEFYSVQQRFEAPALADLPAALHQAFSRFQPRARIEPGQRVAVAVGSRGISRIADLTLAAVAYLKQLGLRPFVIPAMGSHGGGSGPGQAAILADLGITEAGVGAPIVSGMEVESLGRVESGAEILVSRDACQADHLVLINRIKPHTLFRGPVESGLCKMLTIGLGKHKGAVNVHKYSLGRTIVPGARRVMDNLSVLFGLGVVETPDHEIHALRVVGPEAIEQTDRELLELAWALFPRLPIHDLDVLILDEMGKNISGAGMDPNVIGMWRREGGLREPDYRTLIVLGLTPESHGNATGIGMADLIPRRLREAIDLKATYTNCLTSWAPRSARIPLTLDNDRVILETLARSLPDLQAARMARIRSTLHLDRFWVTAALLPELRKKGNLVLEETPHEIRFDSAERLQPFP